MCYGSHRLPSKEDLNPPARSPAPANDDDDEAAAVEDLRDRLAQTEERLARARAREAELTRRLHEMKRFVSVMEILETYFRRRFLEQQQQLSSLLSPVPSR
ncbi:hypothetical protein LguiB_018712 [Lonicera macranthoides]